MTRLDWASNLAAAGELSPLIFAAFDTVREVYPDLGAPAREDAIEIVRGWSADRESIVKYAQNAWAPFKRCALTGMADQAARRGMGWLFSAHRAGTGKHGYCKA
jgi:hypothetical protein